MYQNLFAAANEFNEFFTVRFKRKLLNVTENVTENRLKKILSTLKADPKITTTQLSEKLGTTRRTIAWDIELLKEQGVLKRIGPDKGGYWEVINE